MFKPVNRPLFSVAEARKDAKKEESFFDFTLRLRAFAVQWFQIFLTGTVSFEVVRESAMKSVHNGSNIFSLTSP